MLARRRCGSAGAGNGDADAAERALFKALEADGFEHFAEPSFLDPTALGTAAGVGHLLADKPGELFMHSCAGIVVRLVLSVDGCSLLSECSALSFGFGEDGVFHGFGVGGWLVWERASALR